MIFPLSAGLNRSMNPVGRSTPSSSSFFRLTTKPSWVIQFAALYSSCMLGSRSATLGTFAGSIFSTKPAARTTGHVASVISTTSNGGSSWPRAATSFDSRLRGLPVTNSTLPPSASIFGQMYSQMRSFQLPP